MRFNIKGGNLATNVSRFTGLLFTLWHSPTHSLANRHSCSTSAETRDRKCFIMQLILVVRKADMINQIFCQMLSFVDRL